jgi:hypothetical protein
MWVVMMILRGLLLLLGRGWMGEVVVKQLQWPHVHRDDPTRLNQVLPKLWGNHNGVRLLIGRRGAGDRFRWFYHSRGRCWCQRSGIWSRVWCRPS